MEFVTLSDAITIKMNPFYIIQDNIPIKLINISEVISVCGVSNKNGKAFSGELQNQVWYQLVLCKKIETSVLLKI